MRISNWCVYQASLKGGLFSGILAVAWQLRLMRQMCVLLQVALKSDSRRDWTNADTNTATVTTDGIVSAAFFASILTTICPDWDI